MFSIWRKTGPNAAYVFICVKELKCLHEAINFLYNQSLLNVNTHNLLFWEEKKKRLLHKIKYIIASSLRLKSSMIGQIRKQTKEKGRAATHNLL